MGVSMRRATALAGPLALGAALVGLAGGCNALLGNEDVERESPDASTLVRREGGAVDGPFALDDVVTTPEASPPDAGPPCPAPTCITSGDCPSKQVCIGLLAADGGVATRACRRTCEGGTGCITGESCFQGEPTPTCMPIQLECGASCSAVCAILCVDLSRDAKNCGRCGTACPAGKQCVGGACS